ncbi:MAG: hypothetical protein J7K95_01300 [Thermoplasmata archaeon]|nr:hypothetical protein [Thermoplasmata archaeon]
MWKERLRKIKLLVTIIIIIGVATYLIFVYDAAKSISIVDKKIEGAYPVSFDEYEVRFSLTLKNPKNFDIEIDYISYKIYIEDEFVGEGAKPHFFIENGVKKYGFDATFSVKNLSQAGKEALMNGEANLKIKGVIMIPAKFFELFTWKHIKIPYEIRERI